MRNTVPICFGNCTEHFFVDAGNIWTIRDYAEQPGGQFRMRSFWREIAVSYGLGFRLNFDYFIFTSGRRYESHSSGV